MTKLKKISRTISRFPNSRLVCIWIYEGDLEGYTNDLDVVVVGTFTNFYLVRWSLKSYNKVSYLLQHAIMRVAFSASVSIPFMSLVGKYLLHSWTV